MLSALVLSLAALTMSQPPPALTGFAYRCDGVATAATIGAASNHKAVAQAPTVASPKFFSELWAMRLLRLDPAKLDLNDRIVAQNRVMELRFAHRLSADLARRTIDHLAMPPEVFDLIGSQPEKALETILGVRPQWTERRVNQCGSGPLVHERVARGALAFRPLRAGNLRALVSQLIAVDSDGKPHVTPLVGAVEMRRGMQDDAPVCVVKRQPTHQLAPQRLEKLTKTTFIRPHRDGSIGCNACHSSSKAFGARDVPAEQADLLARQRWKHVETFAARQLRQRMAQP